MSSPHNASNGYLRVYVWEQPVRWFHWINVVAITALGVTGWLIANPPAFMTQSEASYSYWFGSVRFVHFASAYVFTANFAFRLYWAFVGNKYAKWRNFFPLRKAQIRQIGEVLQVDVLQSTKTPVQTLGHNSMAYFVYTGTGLLTVFQIISGYALYAPMSNGWFAHLFTWAVPLFGSEFSLRIFHYAVMWAFVVFTIIHVYLVFYHDYVEGHGVLSSMVGGWKFMHKKAIEAEEASGISPYPSDPTVVKPDAKKGPAGAS
jgi:Ni/Fe-hydrogenase 1 B-type cytochrome subunit